METLLEILANIEHQRWSRWQKYVFEISIRQSDGSVVIPAPLVERWQKQIDTEYVNLSEKEKDSDRVEAEITINALTEFLNKGI